MNTNVWYNVYHIMAKEPFNFSWVIQGKLAGSGRPYNIDLMNWIKNQGVKTIITMTEAPTTSIMDI